MFCNLVVIPIVLEYDYHNVCPPRAAALHVVGAAGGGERDRADAPQQDVAACGAAGKYAAAGAGLNEITPGAAEHGARARIIVEHQVVVAAARIVRTDRRCGGRSTDKGDRPGRRRDRHRPATKLNDVVAIHDDRVTSAAADHGVRVATTDKRVIANGRRQQVSAMTADGCETASTGRRTRINHSGEPCHKDTGCAP
jgi:hypothetical protein